MAVTLHVRSASNVSITPDIPEYEHPDPPLADVYEREEEKKGVTLTRPLGDSEISYYLPSKEDGGSDMYVRLTLLLHPSNFTPHRLHIAFSILQIRHPLLAARVVSNYDTFSYDSELEARFEFDAPSSNVDAVRNAERYVEIRDGPDHTLEGTLTSYVDGPRTLSDDLTCKLVLVRPHPPPPSFVPREFTCLDDLDQVEPKIKIEMCLFSTHFIGDAGSIQFIVKELMYILTFPTAHLMDVILASEIKEMHASITAMGDGLGGGGLLPQSMEARLPPIRGKFKNTLSRLEFMRFQGRMIGGQTLPRKSPPPMNGAGGGGGSPPRSPFKPGTSTPLDGAGIGGADLHKSPPAGGVRPRTSSFKNGTSTPLSGAASVPSGADLHKFLSTYTRQTNTKTHELIISSARTSRLLAKCKKEGVTVNAALFALVGYAWVESQAQGQRHKGEGDGDGDGGRLPSLLYSARNMRPFLPPKPPKMKSGAKGGGWKGWQSYYYLSLSYFNVVLPCWIPGECEPKVEDVAITSEEARKVGSGANGHAITSEEEHVEASKGETLANGHAITNDEEHVQAPKVESVANGHITAPTYEEHVEDPVSVAQVETPANGHATPFDEEHAKLKVEALANGDDEAPVTVEALANGQVITSTDGVEANGHVSTTTTTTSETAFTKVETLANGHANPDEDDADGEDEMEKAAPNGHVDLAAAESEETSHPQKLRTAAIHTTTPEENEAETMGKGVIPVITTDAKEEIIAHEIEIEIEIEGNGHAVTSETGTNGDVHQEEVKDKVVENGHAMHEVSQVDSSSSSPHAITPTPTQDYDGSILTTTVSSTRTVTPIHFPAPSPPSLLASKVFWHRARSARAQSAPPNMESMMSLILFVSRTLQMSKIRKEGSVKFAIARKEGEKKVREVLWRMGGDVGKVLSGLGVRLPPSLSLSLPKTPGPGSPGPGTPTFRTPPATPRLEGPPPPSPSSLKPQNTALHPSHNSPHIPPPAPAQALLGLSCLGSFDPLFPPPAALGHFPTDHVSVLPFEPISLGAGCRLKHGGSLLYAYTFDGCLTVVLGYDAGVLGLREEEVEGLWGKLIEGIGRWMGD